MLALDEGLDEEDRLEGTGIKLRRMVPLSLMVAPDSIVLSTFARGFVEGGESGGEESAVEVVEDTLEVPLNESREYEDMEEGDVDAVELTLCCCARPKDLRDRGEKEYEVSGFGVGLESPPAIAFRRRVSRSIVGLISAARGGGTGTLPLDLSGIWEGDSIPSRFESSSKIGVPSRLFGRDSSGPDTTPRMLFTSSIEGLDLTLARGFTAGLGEPSLKHSSKHSSQHGLPRISTIGVFAMSLSQALHRKQEACQRRPAFSTGLPPSSFTRAYMG
jgi:hypothetical protein